MYTCYSPKKPKKKKKKVVVHVFPKGLYRCIHQKKKGRKKILSEKKKSNGDLSLSRVDTVFQ